MIEFEEYISVGRKRLRCGYTTGTCATAAAYAAARALLLHDEVDVVKVETPSDVDVLVEIETYERGEGWAECSVQKDSGDDPDVTCGVSVYARVCLSDDPGIAIDGGIGVGRVTKPGLDQPVGSAAINSTPRKMIERSLSELADATGYAGGLQVCVSIPDGVKLAAKTFNPRLGITGGISVLGTTGIVRPMSEDALISSIRLEMSVLKESGHEGILLVPGNYGRDFARDELGMDMVNCVQCSNYLGAALDAVSELGFLQVTVIGHIGKLAKVAAGSMNTHSRVADGRAEALTAHAALVGVTPGLAKEIMSAPTTDAMLSSLEDAKILEPVMESLFKSVVDRISSRLDDETQLNVLMFSKQNGVLGSTFDYREMQMMASGRGERL